jgi:hypothetical protein
VPRGHSLTFPFYLIDCCTITWNFFLLKNQTMMARVLLSRLGRGSHTVLRRYFLLISHQVDKLTKYCHKPNLVSMTKLWFLLLSQLLAAHLVHCLYSSVNFFSYEYFNLACWKLLLSHLPSWSEIINNVQFR